MYKRLGIFYTTISFLIFFFTPSAYAVLTFDQLSIDANFSGDVKLLGDLDGDGKKDVIVAGASMYWYKNPTWTKTFIADSVEEFTTDGKMDDLDGDGDLDIIVPDGLIPNNLLWFRNNANASSFTKLVIGTIGTWGKDVHIGDFDENGRKDVAVRSETGEVYIFYQTTASSFTKVQIGVFGGGEGMGSGDVDGDGDTDIIGPGYWMENTKNIANTNWTKYVVGSLGYNQFKAVVSDIDKNGMQDILYSCSECSNDAEIQWYSASTPKGSWTKHSVGTLAYSHTLQTADMDLDGDIDIVTGQMVQSSTRQVIIYENMGNAGTWTKRVVGTPVNGIHNGVIGDIDSDGDIDIVGSNWIGNNGIYWWKNNSTTVNPTVTPTRIATPIPTVSSSLSWQYRLVTSTHQQTFGLAATDIDRDGKKDIVSGRYWYKNSGDVAGAWTLGGQFPNGIHVFAALDVDGDLTTDLVGQKTENGVVSLYWLEGSASSFTSTLLGTVPQASHDIGFQGYRIGQLDSGGKEEVIVSSGGGIYYFKIPSNPAGNWTKIVVNANPSDEGFGIGDIDNDGHLDVAAGTGDSKRVEWYKNPGNGTSNWTAYQIGNMNDAVFPDRFAVADLNADGKLDIIGTEENGLDSGAKTFWWRQPSNPTSSNWTRSTITTQASTNSMDVGDVDNDGDTDIVLGEHRGSKKVAVWKNNASGVFTESIVDTGKESHLGARLFDLDNDNDLDIVSIAWDDPSKVHVWKQMNTSTKTGDGNGDGKVDGLDYILWLLHYDQSVSGANNGDFNISGKVDGIDYVVWLNNYGS